MLRVYHLRKEGAQRGSPGILKLFRGVPGFRVEGLGFHKGCKEGAGGFQKEAMFLRCMKLYWAANSGGLVFRVWGLGFRV